MRVRCAGHARGTAGRSRAASRHSNNSKKRRRYTTRGRRRPAPARRRRTRPVAGSAPTYRSFPSPGPSPRRAPPRTTAARRAPPGTPRGRARRHRNPPHSRATPSTIVTPPEPHGEAVDVGHEHAAVPGGNACRVSRRVRLDPVDGRQRAAEAGDAPPTVPRRLDVCRPLDLHVDRSRRQRGPPARRSHASTSTRAEERRRGRQAAPAAPPGCRAAPPSAPSATEAPRPVEHRANRAAKRPDGRNQDRQPVSEVIRKPRELVLRVLDNGRVVQAIPGVARRGDRLGGQGHGSHRKRSPCRGAGHSGEQVGSRVETGARSGTSVTSCPRRPRARSRRTDRVEPRSESAR